MIFINKDARKWVIDFTLAALAISFILTDVRAITVDLAYTDMFALDYMEIILPVVLVITIAQRQVMRRNLLLGQIF